MTQGVDSRFFLDAAVDQSRFEGALHTAGIHGLCRLRASSGGKEPLGMTMGLPLLAQQGQRGCRERHTAVFGAFALANMNEQTVTVNIGDLQLQTLLQP